MSDNPVGSSQPVTAKDARNCAKQLFEPAYVVDEEQEPEVVIDGLLFRLGMWTAELGKDVTLTLFVNPGPVGRLLWQREAKTLLRLGNISHPALPHMRDAGERTFDEPVGGRICDVAFVITDRAPANLGDPVRAKAVGADPRAFVRQLTLLADALFTIHIDGLLHRNIQPRTITVDDNDGGGLCITGFEMSSLQANLLRRGVELEEQLAAQAVTNFINQGRPALAAVPPERLEYLLVPGQASSMPEQVVGDVYSLGVVAYVCLVGDHDEALLADAFPVAEPNAAGHRLRYEEAGWRKLHRAMVDGISLAPIGPTFRRILLWMLDPDPGARPPTSTLVKELRKASDRIFEELAPGDQPAYLVAVDPRECKVLQDWGWIPEQPLNTDAGQLNAIRFLNEDLRSAWLEYAPGELVENIRAPVTRGMEDAEYVLRGRLGSYYGELFKNLRSTVTGGPAVLEDVFMIKWSLPRESEADTQALRRGHRIHALKVVPFWRARLEAAGERPPWRPVMRAAKRPRTPRQEELESALRWLLSYQRVSSEARKYPFTVDEDSRSGRSVTIRFDQARDRAWRIRDPLRNLFTRDSDRRPKFGDFFSAGEDRDFDGTIRWWPDGGGAPKLDRSLAGSGVVEWAEPDRMGILVEEGDLPSKGWVEPFDEEGQSAAFERQLQAVSDLTERPTLMASLLTPQASLVSEGEWQEAAQGFTVRRPMKAGAPPEELEHRALEGERSQEVLQRMLTSEPIYVLQGPPGSGKTTITARAIRAALRRNPTLRILVSAQSHYALDNLALEVRRTMPDEPEDPIAVRLVSRNTESKVSNVKDWTPRSILKHRPREVEASVARYLAEQAQTLPGDVRGKLEEWHAQIRSARAEIADRTFRGANLVFATCLHSATTGQALVDRPPPFDWVIVEEAAKALPTELAVPLVRGPRWTLIGDHKQLSAYRVREMHEFLELCMQQPEDMGLAPLLQHASTFGRFFELFECFFDPAAGSALLTWHSTAPPVDALNVQRRMVRPIGELVRDAFYPNALESVREASGPPPAYIPRQFADTRLIWLNTDGEEEMVRAGLQCEGEVFIVGQLLEKMWGSLTPSPEDLAILSPYRKQCHLLSTRLEPRFRSLVHTVDSFQGREAEVIVVSLVRGYQRWESRRPSERGEYDPAREVRDRIGHLADPARANVLISRAREYLVLIGQFNHFHDAGRLATASELPGGFWKTVCERFQSSGRIIDTNAWFGGYGGDPL